MKNASKKDRYIHRPSAQKQKTNDANIASETDAEWTWSNPSFPSTPCLFSRTICLHRYTRVSIKLTGVLFLILLFFIHLFTGSLSH